MKPHSFDPWSFVLAALSFFSGCLFNQPPEPVVIHAPTSVVQENREDKKGLLIAINGQGDVAVRFVSPAAESDRKLNGNELSATLRNPSVEDLKSVLASIDAVRSKSRPFDVYIAQDKNANLSNFKTVLEALKALSIHRFQLNSTSSQK